MSVLASKSKQYNSLFLFFYSSVEICLLFLRGVILKKNHLLIFNTSMIQRQLFYLFLIILKLLILCMYFTGSKMKNYVHICFKWHISLCKWPQRSFSINFNIKNFLKNHFEHNKNYASSYVHIYNQKWSINTEIVERIWKTWQNRRYFEENLFDTVKSGCR